MGKALVNKACDGFQSGRNIWLDIFTIEGKSLTSKIFCVEFGIVNQIIKYIWMCFNILHDL